MSRNDPHSFADLEQGRVQHVHLHLAVDFERRQLRGSARLELAEAGTGPLDLDCRGLLIDRIVDEHGQDLAFDLGHSEPLIGQRLRVHRPVNVGTMTVHYATGEGASGLMWLDAAQTAGDQPFVLSQCQAVHARSLIPVQDTPSARITYEAALTLPSQLTAVMSAAPGKIEPVDDDTIVQTFSMPQPIPPYLFALATGALCHRDLGPRTRVYAEASVLDAASWEFAEVEQMLEAAEQLFGPYEWQRFDFVVLPPSFPLGGMENPRMTFLTPTLLAGDRSLVGVLAHELAHSWTGNLVTNANNEHFWLNEGWTVYAERRILQALYGAEEATQASVLGRHVLDEIVAQRQAADLPTALVYDQSRVDPDEDFSTLPYEKGFLLITALERAVGRPRFDVFVRAYIERFRFTSITTNDFVHFVRQALPEANGVDLHAWIHGAGLPDSAPTFVSERLADIEADALRWSEGSRPDELSTWSTNEKLHLMNNLPDDLAVDEVVDLGELLGDTMNAEIRSAWLGCAARAGVPDLGPDLRAFIGSVGRTKLLRPVVGSMMKGGVYRPLAHELVEANLGRLHASTVGTLRALLGADAS